MHLTEIQPQCQVGQFWAELNPLTLHRVKSPGDGMILFETWHPLHGFTDTCMMGPLDRDNWRFLWHQGYLPQDYFLLGSVYPGDALRDEAGVWLVGPSDKGGEILILSDVQKSPSRQAIRFQTGVHPIPGNRYEVLLSETQSGASPKS